MNPFVSLQVVRPLERLGALITLEGTFSGIGGTTAGPAANIRRLLGGHGRLRITAVVPISNSRTATVSLRGSIGRSLPLRGVLRSLARVWHLVGIHTTVLTSGRAVAWPTVGLRGVAAVRAGSRAAVDIGRARLVSTPTILGHVHGIAAGTLWVAAIRTRARVLLLALLLWLLLLLLLLCMVMLLLLLLTVAITLVNLLGRWQRATRRLGVGRSTPRDRVAAGRSGRVRVVLRRLLGHVSVQRGQV